MWKMVTTSDIRSPGQDVDSVTRPNPRMNAEQILVWMICWPWSLVWTLLVHNPLRHVVQFAFVEVLTTLEEISCGEFQEIERDLTMSDPPPVPHATADRPANKSQHPQAHTQAAVTRSGSVTRLDVPAPNAVPAYVPPPLAVASSEPDLWLSHADGQPRSTHGDTAWLQDAWHDTP